MHYERKFCQSLSESSRDPKAPFAFVDGRQVSQLARVVLALPKQIYKILSDVMAVTKLNIS